jgi:DDE superfamily endonuclease
MQATCDSRRRFLDIDIQHPGATSDYLAFALSGLHRKLDSKGQAPPFLDPALALYGDNAYVNTPWMVTPYKLARGSKDAFNFYHSQLRITIECAFGMLVHRWGILRKAMPLGITVRKTTALVMALCKLHNFCIDASDTGITKTTAADSFDISLHGGFGLNGFQSENSDSNEDFEYCNERDRINELLDGGNHWDDAPPCARRARHKTKQLLPNEVMLRFIEEQGFQRPVGGRKIR